MKRLSTLALLLIAGAVAAQTDVPHTFESGEPARASEVNENFNALAEAINDLADAIRDLEGNSSSSGETVLDFSSVVVEIDQPGFYVLDRDWDLAGLSLVISASRVTVNLRGYELAGGSPTVSISGQDVVLRNGEIRGSGPVTIHGTSTLLEDLQVRGRDAGVFVGEFEYFDGDEWSSGGDGATLRDSHFACSNCVAITVVADGVEIDGNTISGDAGSVWYESFFWYDAIFSTPRITNNEIYCGNGVCLKMEATDGTFVIEKNRIFRGEPDYAGPLVAIDAGYGRFIDNEIWGNPYDWEIWESVGIQVNGSGNLIQGTRTVDGELRIGMQFTQSGNTYGDNCLSGYEGNIVLGGTTQKDLGGNCPNEPR